jgi:ABC-type branched-subunit amino acid transport system substrate-binding protein
MTPRLMRYAAAAAMAAYHVNHRIATLVPNATQLIPFNFRLVLDIQDTFALPSMAVRHVVEWNHEGRHVIVGSYRSAVTGPAALAASIEDTPVISYASTASSLVDRDTFPTLSRTVPSDSAVAHSTIDAIAAMGWTRIAIVYVNDAWGRCVEGISVAGGCV